MKKLPTTVTGCGICPYRREFGIYKSFCVLEPELSKSELDNEMPERYTPLFCPLEDVDEAD